MAKAKKNWSLHTTKLKHGVKGRMMRFLEKQFLWINSHFKSAILKS